jgi:hypothetical protein
MSGERLTTWIDGREALPVRAIPYADGWMRFSPDVVARYLAQDDDLFTEWDIPLVAYRQTDDVPIAAVPAREWDAVAASLAGFAEETGDGDSGYSVWRKHAVEKLPAGVFVWLDEFEAVHKSMCARLLLVPARSGDDDLTLSPVLPDGGVVAMVLDGFADKAQLAELPADSGSEGDAPKVDAGATAEDAPLNSGPVWWRKAREEGERWYSGKLKDKKKGDPPIEKTQLAVHLDEWLYAKGYRNRSGHRISRSSILEQITGIVRREKVGMGWK